MSYYRKQLAQSLLLTRIPAHLHMGIIRWIFDGIKPGSFLCAVFSNQLVQSVLLADYLSAPAIPDIVWWLSREAPVGSYGESSVLTDWTGLTPTSKSETSNG